MSTITSLREALYMYDNIIECAEIISFKKLGETTYECTRDQIIMLCVMVAQEAIKQARDEQNNKIV